jgi:hypothetical protein
MALIRSTGGDFGMTAEQRRRLREYRDARDPLKHYVPGPTQLRFHQSPARFKLITGGNRSGKTAAKVVDISWKARGIHPYFPSYGPIRVFMFAQSRQQCAQVIARKMFEASEFPGAMSRLPMIPDYEIEDIGWIKVGFRVPYYAKLKNGSEIMFGWSGVESTWKRFQGGQYDIVDFDENACEGVLLKEAYARVMDARSDPSKPWGGGILWSATGTQVDENFTEFRNRCQDPDEHLHEMFKIPPGESGAAKGEALAEFSAMLTDEEREIRITGDSTLGDILSIYGKQWSDVRHMRDHDYIIKPDDNLWISYDPGVDHPTGILCAVVNKENPDKVRVVKCFNHRRETLEFDVECIVNWLAGRRLEGLVYDPSAKKTEHSTGQNVKNQLEILLARRGVQIERGFLMGRNRHKDGIAVVREYLDPDPYKKQVEAKIEFNVSEESGCQLAKRQMIKYRSYEAGKYTGVKGVVKRDDEMPDCIRYLVCARPAWNKNAPCGNGSNLLVPQLFGADGQPTSHTAAERQRFHAGHRAHLLRSEASRRGIRGVRLW